VFQPEAPTDNGKMILKDAAKETMPHAEDAEEGNTQAEYTGAGDNSEGDKV
jgi:hypothetical protein